ncbi:MAG: type II secretion system F family protein [Lachnospiraceae bacterium]
MAEYTYAGIDEYGKEKKGRINSNSVEEAKKHLKSDGIIALDINPATVLNKSIELSIGSQVKARDLSVFCRQFVSMISAGVTIIDALEMLGEQTENKMMSKAIRGVQTEIEKGETLATAMEQYPKVFPSLMISMVAAGEASGKLELILGRMASHFEKSAKLKALMTKASVYPIIVSLVAITVVIVMLVKIVPSYTDMFDQMGTELPKITQMIVAASDFLLAYWYFLLPVVIVILLGFRAFRRMEAGQIFFGNLARKMPIFGKLTIKTAASQYARTLSTMLFSGMPMIQALGITANTMSNYLYKRALLQAKDVVAKGVPLSEPIAESGIFPSMVTHMTKIGEETGDLEDMLNRLADYYDEEVEMTTQTVMAALEPMIILVLAVVVGVLIAAVMSPMLAMYQSLDSL